MVHHLAPLDDLLYNLIVIDPNVNDYVSVELATEKPYEFHPVIVKKYPPGQLKKFGMGRGKWKLK
jgi:hypothetical protein